MSVCNICKKEFQYGLKRHLEVHKKAKYNCLQCDKTYTRKDALKNHVIAGHHGERKECMKCCNTFLTSTALRYHIESIHENKLYNCKICDKSFKSPHHVTLG